MRSAQSRELEEAQSRLRRLEVAARANDAAGGAAARKPVDVDQDNLLLASGVLAMKVSAREHHIS